LKLREIKDIWSIKKNVSECAISKPESNGVFDETNTDISWVDEYMQNVRGYLSVRIEDNLLIKRPNIVHKLNSSGALILKELLNGTSVADVVKSIGDDQNKRKELGFFLNAIRSCVDNGANLFTENPAVEQKVFSGSFHSLPVLSEIAITYKCNLKCGFCYAGCDNTGKTMTLKDVKKILHKIRYEACVPSVSFTGGEPLSHADLPAMIRYAKKLDMRVNLISNGTLITDDMASKLVYHGLDSAQISMEGISAEIHDKLTGVSGSFVKMVSGIDALIKTGINVHTNTTLTTQNCEQAVYLPRFVKEKFGFTRCSMNLIIPTGSGMFNPDLFIRYSDAGSIIDKIHSAANETGVEFMWYSPLPLCIYNTIGQGLGAKGCSACDGLLSIDPDGNVLPCSAYDESMGNLLREQFSTIWNSQRALKIRKKEDAPEGCSECDNFAICTGACPLYWNVLGTSELNRSSIDI
jgi:radical SAM protein with 4Fe4S-binding SPASM domain